MWMWENNWCVFNEKQERATPEIKAFISLDRDGETFKAEQRHE